MFCFAILEYCFRFFCVCEVVLEPSMRKAIETWKILLTTSWVQVFSFMTPSDGISEKIQ